LTVRQLKRNEINLNFGMKSTNFIFMKWEWNEIEVLMEWNYYERYR